MVKIQLTKIEAKLVYDCVDSQTSYGRDADYTDSEWKALTNAQSKLWKAKEGLTDG